MKERNKVRRQRQRQRQIERRPILLVSLPPSQIPGTIIALAVTHEHDLPPVLRLQESSDSSSFSQSIASDPCPDEEAPARQVQGESRECMVLDWRCHPSSIVQIVIDWMIALRVGASSILQTYDSSFIECRVRSRRGQCRRQESVDWRWLKARSRRRCLPSYIHHVS